MIGRLTVLAAISAALLSATPSIARQSDADRDLVCMAVFAAAAGQLEQGSAEMAAVSSAIFFYLGRLEGRDPSIDWLEYFAQHVESIPVATFAATAESCGEEIESRGQSMMRWGAEMQTRGT